MKNFLLLLCLLWTCFAHTEGQLLWTFFPEELVCIEHENATVQFNVTWCYSKNALLRIVPQRSYIAQVVENSSMVLPAAVPDLKQPTNTSSNGSSCTVITGTFVVYGKRLGRSKLYLMVEYEVKESETEYYASIARAGPNNNVDNRSSYQQIANNRIQETDKTTGINSSDGKLPSTKKSIYEYMVVVGRTEEKNKQDFYFMIAYSVLVVILTFIMGCKLQGDIIVSILKKPVQPAIGLGCQFVIMPLVSFGISKAMNMEPEFGLGLFTLGCSPGGGASNMWTILLNGDLDLSMTMTFMSTLLAFGVMPLWTFALSRFYVADVGINIPFLNIFAALCLIGVPCVIGLLLQKFRPLIARKITRIIKPGCVILLLLILALGSYVNLYMFPLMFSIWYVVPGGIALPWIAAFVAYVVAKIFKQPHKRAITIAVETGIQNTGIAIIILKFSLLKPEGDLSAILPIASAFFSPVPLYIALAVVTIRTCVLKRRRGANSASKMESKQDKMQNSKLINGDIEEIKNNDTKTTSEALWLDCKTKNDDNNSVYEKVSSV